MMPTTATNTPEERVRAAAGRYDDERGTLTASALAALARRQATAGKTCARCGERKPFSAFGRDTAQRDGLRGDCRSCRRRIRRPPRKTEPAQPVSGVMGLDWKVEKVRLIEAGQQRCTQCGIVKPVGEFRRNASKPSGYGSACLQCNRESSARYRATPGGQARQAEARARYAASARGRRAAAKNARPRLIDNPELRAAWEEADLWRCAYCDAAWEEVDHVVPVSAGGSDAIGNLVPACRDCNRGVGGKHSRPVDEWLAERAARSRTDGPLLS